MVFRCDGVDYDTGQLHVFDTGDAHTPFVYVTPDYARVMVGTVDRWRGFDVHRAGEPEIRQLIERFGLEALRRALP